MIDYKPVMENTMPMPLNNSSADPEGGTGGPDPLKNKKNIGFSCNTGPDPLKNCSYQASIQCWAIIGTPAKCHLIAVRWRADGGPLTVVLGSSLPSSTRKKHTQKKKKKRCQSWTPSDKTFMQFRVAIKEKTKGKATCIFA